MIGNLNNSQKNPSAVRKTENKVMTSSSCYDNTDDNFTLVLCSHLGYPTIKKRVWPNYCLTRTMLGQFARASSVTVYQNVFGVPSFDVKQDTFTLRTGDYVPNWVGRHISHVNTPSWWRSLFTPIINSTHLCCVWCLLQVSMTDLRCDSESVVMVRHWVSTQVIHDIGRSMLPQSGVFVIYWTYGCKLSKQASHVLRKYFFSSGITRSVDKKSFSLSASLYLRLW